MHDLPLWLALGVVLACVLALMGMAIYAWRSSQQPTKPVEDDPDVWRRHPEKVERGGYLWTDPDRKD